MWNTAGNLSRLYGPGTYGYYEEQRVERTSLALLSHETALLLLWFTMAYNVTFLKYQYLFNVMWNTSLILLTFTFWNSLSQLDVLCCGNSIGSYPVKDVSLYPILPGHARKHNIYRRFEIVCLEQHSLQRETLFQRMFLRPLNSISFIWLNTNVRYVLQLIDNVWTINISFLRTEHME